MKYITINERIYARDSNGRIKAWEIKVIQDTDDTKSSATILSYDGLLLGKRTSRVTKITEGKNIGKENETTPYEQAVSEATSKYNNKLKKGYKTLNSINGNVDFIFDNDLDLEHHLQKVMPLFNTDKNGNVKPMLAYPLYKKLTKGVVPRIKFPAFGQPKYNGVRCLASFVDGKVKLISREGITYRVPHVEKELFKIFTDLTETLNQLNIVFDGELYIHDTILSDIVSAVKSDNMFTASVQYMIYDIAIVDHEQDKRLNSLNVLRDFYTGKLTCITFTETQIINTLKEAELYTDKCILDGYEGSIFRTYKNIYKFGLRSSDMVKLKRKESSEFTIIDVVDSVNAPGLGMFVCKNDISDDTFEVVPQGTHELRKQYFENSNFYINRLLTVEFYERTKDGLPFHATGITIRNYE